ncbi:putative quinol monooxygenase [Shewanella xiamenensis]|uniref:Antibiotic biosynthesis monooxygenase n=1 Tax=Shewanella xiamenensis TaxID=332186 RepID=A0ABT6UDY4_9GAMM|nr:putative quinol monooxygenase [Shewanella xiamenensis]MDI5832682.1 antibiotic biosynthesis monooxygenase [Shewanella xiamenensis]
MKITVFAQIQAHSGQSDSLFKVLKQLVSDTHTEAGCLEYTLHHSLDNANKFWMYEVWRSQTALDAHMASPHFNTFVATSELLVEKVEIHKCYAC